MISKAKRFLRPYLGPVVDVLRDLRLFVSMPSDPLGKTAPDRTGGRRHILLIDEMLPDPRFGAGYPRAAQLLRSIIAEGWEATVYPLSAKAAHYTEARARFPKGAQFLKSYGVPGLRRLLKTGVGRFDAVLVSRASTMATFATVCAGTPQFLRQTYCIYDAEAIFTLREAQRLAIFGRTLTAPAIEDGLKNEIELVSGADAVIAVSEAEAAVFRHRTQARVHIVSHAVEIKGEFQPFSGRTNLLIVGRFTGPREQSPNVDSLMWFVEEVMPVLDTMIGTDYQLIAVGLASEDLVNRLASKRVVFTGVVNDVSDLYARCRVFVAPTRFAAGIPLKVIEAAAWGIPCVVTNLLARQLGLENGKHALAADAHTDFAAACAKLYEDPELWNSVRDEALRSVGQKHSLEAFGTAVHAMLTEASAGKLRAGPHRQGRASAPLPHP